MTQQTVFEKTGFTSTKNVITLIDERLTEIQDDLLVATSYEMVARLQGAHSELKLLRNQLAPKPAKDRREIEDGGYAYSPGHRGIDPRRS